MTRGRLASRRVRVVLVERERKVGGQGHFQKLDGLDVLALLAFPLKRELDGVDGKGRALSDFRHWWPTLPSFRVRYGAFHMITCLSYLP